MASAGTVSGDRWVEDRASIETYLATDPELYAVLTAAGKRAVDYARAIAPVGTAAEGDEHPGAYRDSIRVERDEEGPGMRLFSDDNKAFWIEYGAAHMPRRRVLGRAVDRIQV